MNKKLHSEAVDHFFRAILTLKTEEECYQFFEDVSAVNEAAGTKEKLKITAPCWIMLALVNVLSCICTELGVALGCGLVAILTIVLLYASKRWTVLVGAFLAVIPNLAYVAFYLILGGGA